MIVTPVRNELKITEVIRLNHFHSTFLDSDIPYADLFLPISASLLTFELLICSQFTPPLPPRVFWGRERVHLSDFFQGGCSFYIKNKLKSEIFNDKKSL